MKRGVGALFVAFLAARIFLGPVATPSAPPAGPQRPVIQQTHTVPPKFSKVITPAILPGANPAALCQTSSELCPAKGLLDAVQAFFGAASTADLAKRWYVSGADAKQIHFIVATVPDPVHTHLSLFFDRQVVAIEEAVQQGNYLFSSAYLPWDNVQHTEDDDYHVRLEQQDYQAAREEYPGLLLFHNAGTAANVGEGLEPLFVFLVAETPTGGINKSQFDNAIEAIAAMCGAECPDGPPTGGNGSLFVLGPTFSGSLYSLRALLNELKGPDGSWPAITVDSGAATDDHTIDWFRASTKDLSTTNPSRKDLKGAAVAFRTFQATSGPTVMDLLAFFCGEGYRADQLALLSEDETAYGNVASAPARSETCPNDKNARMVHYYFPRDISELRNAYEKDLELSAESGNSNAPRSTLPLNLEDTGNDDDSVPSFAQGQTPLSEEAVLMGIVSDLRERDVHLIAVEATNSLDIVFVVRYLRVAYPDARILTVDTDLLLPRQVDDPHLHGVMQITSYPLISGIEDEPTNECGRNLHRIFPSDYSEGTFEAARSLMPARHNPQPDPCSKSAVAPPNLPAAEPVWLTVLGRDQFWPVSLYGLDVKLHPDLPPAWIVIFALSAAFGFIYALLALKGNVISASIFLANFAHVKDRWRNRTLLLCGVLIFDIFFCLLWPRFWTPGHGKWLVFILLGVACLVVWDQWRRGGWRLVPWFLALGVASFAALEYAFGSQTGQAQVFMRYRYVHVTSGVSPFVPFLLLFAAFLWAGWHNLAGRPPWDYKGTGSPLPGAKQVIGDADSATSTSNQRLTKLTDYGNTDLLRLIQPSTINYRVAILTFVTLLVPLLAAVILVRPHTVQSFEGPRYDLAYTIFLILAVALVLWDTFRLSFIWLELKSLLMALDRLPLRRGFVRMAGFKSRRLWELGGNTFEDFFAVLSSEIQTISALSNSRPHSDELRAALHAVQHSVTAFLQWIHESRSPGGIAEGTFSGGLVVLLREARKSVGYPGKRFLKSFEGWVRQDQASSVTGGGDFTNLLVVHLRRLQKTLASACATTLRDLNHEWNQEKRPAWEAECMVREKTECKDLGLPLAVRLSEDFVCLFYFSFISSIFGRMRALLLTVAGVYVFILLSFSSYPFEPSSAFHTVMIFLLILVTLAVGIVYGQAHKDSTISRITDTEVGKLGVEFWFRLVGFVAVPLLSLLAAKFPEIGGFLFSWIEPASQAFK